MRPKELVFKDLFSGILSFFLFLLHSIQQRSKNVKVKYGQINKKFTNSRIISEKAIARDVLPLFSLHGDRFLKEKRSSVKLKANTDGRSGYIIGFCSNQIKLLRALP